MQNSGPISFSLYTQDRKNRVILKNHQQDNFINQTAREILENKTLINGLSPDDIKIIRSIAESQLEILRTA